MQSIRILRVIARINVGGPAVQITSLMGTLNPEEFEQILVTGYCENNEVDYLNGRDVNFKVVRIVGFGRSINIIHDFKSFLALIKIIRKFKPHIIHTHTAKAGATGRLAGLLARPTAKRIHTYHGHLLNGYYQGLKLFIIILIEKLLSRITSHLIAVGEIVRDDLIKAGIGRIDKFSVIKPGIELEKSIDNKYHLLRNQYSKESIIVTYIGRLTKIKRIDRLIEVIDKVHLQNKNVIFFIAGGGEDLEILKQSIKNRNLPIKLLGWVEDVSTLLAVTDILLLTSDNEGTPISIIQAGLSKVPAISTSVGSVSELIIHEKTGYLCELDSSDIAEKVIKLSKMPVLRKEFGKNSFELMKAKFSKDRFISEHKSLYRKI